jgi:hypothetical protein
MRKLCALSVLALLFAAHGAAHAGPVSDVSLKEIDGLYRVLIDAENRHDLATVRQMLWQSPDTLFVAKTATPAEGNWAGFWGADVVMQHFAELYAGTFVMAPHYDRVKTVRLTSDVAETYAPLDISVSYAGQTPAPKPFLMVLAWVRTPDGWKMATDVVLPIPAAPANKS